VRPFEEVVAEHGSVVLRVCRVLLGPNDAEDAWSETFLAALRAYPQLPATANVQAWLVTIAHRKAIDAVRAGGRRPVPTHSLPERLPAPTDPTDTDLTAAVRALPARQRAAVAYHYLAGWPYREVAELVGGTPDAVRRSAADGVRTLRRTYPDLSRPELSRPELSRAELSRPELSRPELSRPELSRPELSRPDRQGAR
jgi:RNA polymerase sigma factor (sigma-70 family)